MAVGGTVLVFIGFICKFKEELGAACGCDCTYDGICSGLASWCCCVRGGKETGDEENPSSDKLENVERKTKGEYAQLGDKDEDEDEDGDAHTTKKVEVSEKLYAQLRLLCLICLSESHRCDLLRRRLRSSWATRRIPRLQAVTRLRTSIRRPRARTRIRTRITQ